MQKLCVCMRDFFFPFERMETILLCLGIQSAKVVQIHYPVCECIKHFHSGFSDTGIFFFKKNRNAVSETPAISCYLWAEEKE